MAARAAFLRASRGQHWTPLSPENVAQPAGFQIVSYTPQQATVQALASVGRGSYQEVTRSVRWVDGDWRLLMTPQGSDGTDPLPVTSMSGYTPWGAHG